MAVQIGEKKQAGFDDPLGMLSDCHRRIERFLAALLLISRSKRGGELSQGEKETLSSALEYFRTSGPRHTADEEESLFPRMRNCAAAAKALERIEALESDHTAASQAHDEVDALGRRWLETGHLAESDAARMAALLDTLSALYARHIEIEDQQVFPLAGQALEASDVSAIGDEMARRRGLR
ncbi:MAG TPA: hemerythrin domain-containing protein [Bryobacteraceae bacterium]|nr:hemerythrin domain-containing protein [Bryobacteraceae bacterium]